VLESALAAASCGRGRLMLVSGEPGIGKTSLARELGKRAQADGITVVWGRCPEGSAVPAYSPWSQGLRGCLGGADAPELPRATRILVAQIVPDLRAPGESGEPLAPVPLDGLTGADQARLVLFDAVAEALRAASAARPLCLILDDLHVADEPSLLLLRSVARMLREARILVLGTHRDAEVWQSPVRSRLMGELSREADQLPLRGLDDEEARQLIEAAAGQAAPAAVVQRLRETTGGNPFFLDELVRVLVAERRLGDAGARGAGEMGVPDPVREAIRRRLEPLPPESAELLGVAAVIGQEFDLAVLACALPREPAACLDLLEVSCAGGLLRRVADSVGRYRFAHALIREAMYDELPPARRQILHCAVGRALETLYAHDLEPVLPALAHHFFRAAVVADGREAAAYCRRAGERAMRLLAYEDAERELDRALEVLPLPDPPGDPTRCELLLALGEAAYRAGHAARVADTFARATAVARHLGDATMLARVLLAMPAPVEVGAVDHRRIEQFEAVLDGLPADACALRARLMARLAWELYWSDEHERRRTLSHDAVAMARTCGDPGALAYTLGVVRFALWGPANAEERFDAASEILRLAEQAGDHVLAMEGHHWRVIDLLHEGDIEAVDREIEAAQRRAMIARAPQHLWWTVLWRGMRATLAGRFEEAERLIGEAVAQGERVLQRNADAACHGQMFVLLLHQGRLEHLIEGQKTWMAANPYWAEDNPGIHCGLAWLYAELGCEAGARHEFEALAATGFSRLRMSGDWLSSVVGLAEACAFLGDQARAATLLAMLEPYAGRNVVIGPAIASFGPVSRFLGLLAATIRRWEAAVAYFEDALRLCRRLDSPPFLARTQYDYAAALHARGAPGDRERAAQLLAEARETAQRLGMERLAARCALLHAGPPAATAAVPARAAVSTAVLAREGEYWAVTFEGPTVRVRDSAGVRHLARLLAAPEVETPALELAAGSRDERPRLGDAGEVLDPRARAAYRARLAELSAEREEAEAMHDLGRVERLQAELDFVGRELAAAVGLGGAARRAGSAAERARVNVTRALKSAIGRLAAADPALGAHLEHAVRTGTFCVYTPDPRAAVRWQVVVDAAPGARRAAGGRRGS
jgi:tetratricopeptide (TPR) repeat protein